MACKEGQFDVVIRATRKPTKDPLVGKLRNFHFLNLSFKSINLNDVHNWNNSIVIKKYIRLIINENNTLF